MFREDGRIDLLRPGYFAEQGIYTIDDGIQYDETMMREQAKEILDDLLKDFPFLNDRSKASVIAADAHNVLRHDAFASRVAARISSLGECARRGKNVIVQNGDRANRRELRAAHAAAKGRKLKVLDALALDASLYALFDNIRGMIQSEEVEAFITSATWGGRMLGESAKFRVDNVTTVFMTGNQTKTSEDMAERCLFVELFIPEADNRDRIIPPERVIDGVSFLRSDTAKPNSFRSLGALLRYWEADGKPRPPTLMQRFQEWSRVVGGIAIASGYADPLDKPGISSGADVERRDMHFLVQQLAPTIVAEDEGEAPPTRQVWKFAEIIEFIKKQGTL